MKTVKIILLLGIVSLFTSMPYNAAKARDCSNPKGFHQKIMCKYAGESSVTTKEVKMKKKSDWDAVLQKIKVFGGEKKGESD